MSELKEIVDAVKEQVGYVASDIVKAGLLENEKNVKVLLSEADKSVSEKIENINIENQIALKKLDDELKKIGSSLTEVLNSHKTKVEARSLKEVLEESRSDIKKALDGGGNVEFELYSNGSGGFTALTHSQIKKRDAEKIQYDAGLIDKVAGITATISALPAGNGAAISGNFTDAGAIRMTDSQTPIFNLYRNSNFIFNYVNSISAAPTTRTALYIDEIGAEMNPAIVTEGATKPLSQTYYVLRNKDYKKVAHMVKITEEFDMDFDFLVRNIQDIAVQELVLKMQDEVLTGITSSANLYTTGAQYTGGVPITNKNDWDAINAMAAQVNFTTKGGRANVSLVDSFKGYRLGATKDANGAYLNAPVSLGSMSVVPNSKIALGTAIVGDLKQYNVMYRGGVKVKIGYNLDDFSKNQRSIVVEQFYYDWISDNRRASIVADTFANVLAAI